MENSIKTTVAFRCPVCGAILTFDVTRARLEKGPLSMHCIQCSKSKLDIIQNPDSSISLTVPCLVCPHPHPYKISSSMFFEKDIYCFACSYSGIDICFIGKEEFIDDEIIRTGREIRELLEESGNEETSSKNADVMVADTNVVREILFAIGRLQEENKIKCSCGAKSVKILLDYDKINVVCKVCSKKKEIAARTKFDANAAIEFDEVTID